MNENRGSFKSKKNEGGINMRTFKSACECESLEEFVSEHYRLKFDKGRRGLSVAALKWMADQRDIKYPSTIKREELFDLLEEHGVTPIELFREFPESMGVIHFDYVQKFGVTKSEFEKLKRREFFKIIDYDRVKLYGQYVEVPVFCAQQFFSMTREKIDEALATKVLHKKTAV